MSDNSEANPTQTELTSSEQLVGLVPIQAEEQNIGVQLISEGDEDFFGSQAIELNGERHVIVSQAQDPETGELLLVLRGENGEHIAIQPEALSSMVQASGGDHIQVAVESTEASLTIASDISSLSHPVSSELTSLSATLSALPSIIASIPSQTQTTTAPTNVVQSIDTPRVSQEEQPSSLTSVTESISNAPESVKPDKTESSISQSSIEEKSEKPIEENKSNESSTEKKTEEKLSLIDTKEKPIEAEKKNNNKVNIESTSPKKETTDTESVEAKKSEEIVEPIKTNEEKSELKTIPEKKSEVSEKIEEKIEVKETPVTTTTPELSNGLQPIVTSETPSTNVSTDLVQTQDITTPTTATTTTPSISSIEPPVSETITSSEEKSNKVTNDSTELGFGNTAVIQVQDSNSDASLEQLMANAVLTADGNYVLMAQTEDGQVTGLPPELNLSDVINAGAAGGQTFLIETPEGLVACTAASSGEDGAIQLIPTEAGDLENAVISSAQSVGTGVENQIIQAISGQAMSYTINSSTGCLELTAVSAAQPTNIASATKTTARGNRNTRPSKAKVIPAIPSGQTLLLAAETVTDSPTVPTKPVTTQSARNRNTNARNKGRTGVTDSGVNDSAISANIQQIKSNVKTTAEMKSGSALGNNLSGETTTPPGPSQLAASRRTYSKKSNIVWITPDASQGANNTAFATVATASVKSSNTSQPQKQKTSTNSNPSVTKTTVQTSASSPVKANSPSKFVTSLQNTSSPTKVTISLNTSSKPIPTVQSTPTTVTISRSSDLKSSSNKTSEVDKSKSATKTIAPTVTKMVTASKTTVTLKSSSQSNPSKGQTPNLMIETSVDKSRVISKTPIRVSDITATKSSLPSSPTKPTATKTVVTVSSAKDKTAVTKTVAQKTTPTPSKSVASMPSSNKTSSSAKPTTVGSTSSKSNSSSAKQGITSAKSAQSVSIAPEKHTISEKVVTKGKSINEVQINSIEIESTVASDPKPKTTEKSTKKGPEKTVSTRHSARLSPTKSSKAELISVTPKDTPQKQELDTSQLDSKSSKPEEKEGIKNRSELANEESIASKPTEEPIKESGVSSQGQSVDASEKESENLESNDSKSLRKSRRSSRNALNVEESRKETKTVEEIKINETKPKESKEKPKEKAVEAVTTRRTSGRQKTVKEVTNEEKTQVQDSVTTLPSEIPSQTTTETPNQETKSGRITRASSTKKPDSRGAKSDEQLPKTPETKSKTESIEKTKIDLEKKAQNETQVVTEKEVSDKPIAEKEKPVESKEPIVGTVETPTRSVKKRVQFEVKEKSEEKDAIKPNEDKSEKTVTPVATRRSLRSATPQTVNQVQSDSEKEDSDKSEAKTFNSIDESSDKTPQRVSTRKRKEVTKSPELEEVKPAKTPKKSSRKSETIVNQNDLNEEQNSESLSSSRLRDRKSKLVKRIEPRVSFKDVNRHSFESSENYGRIGRKQSLIQSYVDENEWQEKEADLRRKTISSLSDLRSPNECYEYSTNECRFYVRHQSSSVSPKQSAGNYLCQKCGFHTTRINNLVIHHRDQCSYIKNAVIQQWQTVQAELQAKRVRTNDSSLTASSSTSETKRRKLDNNQDLNHSDKQTDESEMESEDERHEDVVTNNDRSNQNPTISDIDAMLMASDDEDLLSIDNIDNPKREFGFAEDDIVWVETNDTHWPAMVSKVFTKEKKAMIKLIDSPWPKKSLKVNTTSISPFDSAEVNKQYLRDGPNSFADILVKAVQKAEEFLRKKCLGSEVSVGKFFDSESETNVEEDRISSIHNENISKETPKTVKEPTLEGSGSVAIESNGDDLEIDKIPESTEAIAQWKEKRRQQNAKLLQCIKDGKVETHLLGVYRGTITSERHQKFLSGSESEKNQLKHVPWFGPIDDEEQQEEIYDYCSQLFKSNFKTDGSFDTVAYIFEVWVPEAIVKAISRVRRLELKDSESIFAKGVILSKSEKDELTKEIQKEAEKQMTSQTTSD